VTAPVAVAVDAAIVLGFLGAAGLALRNREKPGAIPFVALAGFLAAMTVGVGVGRSGTLPPTFTDYVLFVPFVFASLAWVALAFDYTGRGPVVTRRVAAGLAAFGAAVVVTTALNVVVPDSVLPLWFLLVNVLQFGLIAAIIYGAVLVARSALEYGDLPLGGSLLLAVVGTGLFVATVVQILTPPLAYDTTYVLVEVLLGLIAVVLLVVQVRYRVFETGASAGHLARESVLDQMSAAVAITGRDDRLLDLNRTAERTFDVDQPDDLGDPIDEVLGFDPDHSDDRPLSVETSEGRREFEVEHSEITGRGAESVGRAYILRDVTERRTHEQRLDVLDRVLRHNLRNDLDAIRGFAEALERDDAALDGAELAREIRTTAREIADLGSALSTAHSLLEAERLDVDPVDLGPLLDEVAASVRETYPAVSIEVTLEGASEPLRTDRRLLEIALGELVENAAEHGGDDPSVELSARRRADEALIEVRDDGPGIPERERAILLEGEERPLRHGRGLGLWLVYWSVTRLGGRLEFRERDAGGSTVSVWLPDR
jgi:signal transduction histidine kinase